ncbi:MAG: class I SAM-dependent methyltransferase [Limisphaerales bacterium]
MDSSGATAAYTGLSGQRYHGAKRSIPPSALPWVYRVRSRMFQPRVAPDAVVLEWGCGAGWNLAGLRCRRRVGHDVTPDLAEMVRPLGIEFVLDPTTLPSNAFDVVICHHVLEHVPDPLAVLQGFHRMLRPGGRLLLAVPFEKERRYRRFDPGEPNHHLYSWNVQTLGNLLRVAGWECQSLGLRDYGYERIAARWATRLHLGEPGFALVRRLVHLIEPIEEISGVATSLR